jgi:hypothetical protein
LSLAARALTPSLLDIVDPAPNNKMEIAEELENQMSRTFWRKKF